MPGVSLRLVDAAGDAVVGQTWGEVHVRGANRMLGWLGERSLPNDAWFATGDIGHWDEAGRLVLVDRRRETILRAGYTIYPSQVEEVLSQHPDVSEVVVVGRSDDYYGQVLVAVVVGPELDVQALFHFADARLGRHERLAEITLVDTLPMGRSGKVLKRALVADLASGALATIARLNDSDKDPQTE